MLGALLAGGRSRRMGVDKANLEVDRSPLAMRPARVLARVADRLVQVVQTGGTGLAWLDWPVLRDTRQAGPAAGLEVALAEAAAGQTAGGAAIVVVCAVDLPLVTAPLLRQLVDDVRGGARAAAPRTSRTLPTPRTPRGGPAGAGAVRGRRSQRRWHPLVAAYSAAVLPQLRERLDRGANDLQGLLDDVDCAALEGTRLAAFGDPDELLCNVNTPEDLERVRHRGRA